MSLICLALVMLSSSTLAKELTAVEIGKRADEVTVLIGTGDADLSIGLGSGFFMTPHLIATNYHVIKGASVIAYKRVGQEKVHFIKSVRYIDPHNDLAVLEVSPSSFKLLCLGDSDLVKKGEAVYVSGNPHGFEGTLSDGILSAIRKDFHIELLQITAPISPGSSGGPVLNGRGEVIGVATLSFKDDDTQLINFAIPSNSLRSLLKKHGVRLRTKPKPNNGEVKDSEKAKIIEQLKATTVRIIGRDSNGEESLLGSGFFIESDQVATDFHVIQDSELKEMQYLGKRATTIDLPRDDQYPKKDKKHHLAILKVKKAKVEPLSLGNSDDVKIGQQIYIIRDPSRSQVSEGKISDILEKDGVRYFQFDAEVSPGSSGGPVVNSTGDVIAVTALKVPDLSGTLKYAIPAIYLKGLRAGPGDPPDLGPDDSQDLPVIPPPENLLKPGVDFYKAAQFGQAVEYLQSVLDRLSEPKQRALAHLYLGFSRRGLGKSESSVVSEFSEALANDPIVELPPEVRQNHPIFEPMLEKTREETTGTLTVNASPPETRIRIYGRETEQKHSYVGTANVRLFRGDYTVECFIEEARDAKTVKTIRIEPGVHYILDRELARMPSTSRELTLELDRAAKHQRVDVHFEIYDPSGQELDRGVKEMQLQGEKPDLGTWVYRVAWPPSTPAGKLTYRIKVDGEDILPIPPPEIVILEPPTDASVYINQAIDLKARVTSDIQLTEVLVHYGAASKKLRKMNTPDTYVGTVPGRDILTAGTFWYFVTATDWKGKKSRSQVRSVVVRRREDNTIIGVIPHSEVSVQEPRGAEVLPINKPIEVIAGVKSSNPLKEVRVYYDFPRKQLSETSPSTILENKSSDTYFGKIPKERTREEGYIWYFVSATTENGLITKSDDRVVEVREPATRMHQGVWASHSWSNLVSDDGFYSGWERGDVLSLAFLREGKGFQTLGAQLDYTYQNPDYISAMVQWGPSTRENPAAFAFLGGITGYRSSDPSFSRVRQSSQITPLLGGSLKFYPLDRVTVDVTGSVRLQSENSAADRESNFADDYLHHYEMGIRLYISPSLNLKAGYGNWRYGEYDSASVQVGLGATF